MNRNAGIALIVLTFPLAFLIFRKKQPIDFNTHIRPILNQKCLRCHGGVRQQGELSFLTRANALEPAESGLKAIVPGKPQESELIKRIKHHDPEMRMPSEGDPLSKNEIRLLENWIRQGAPWKTHWAYIPPSRNLEPPTLNKDWMQNGIDAFVWRKLQAEGLKPAPEAEKARLARRLSLDLTGLPPDKVLLEKFLSDDRPEAYEQLVDALLDTPHFGERWAAVWLDLARYADSQGYQKDLLRPTMWLYRDWVIHAFNEDMPFDQFTIQQLAGDLLPDPDKNQILATAFHRNTMTNDEGGTDDEEFRVAAVIDRVNTTFEIWQASTISCVQCHSHPYDPLYHEEFYKLYAFFNNTADNDLTSEEPKKSLLSPIQKIAKTNLGEQLAILKNQGDTLSTEFRDKMAVWMKIKPNEIPVMQELAPDSSRVTKVFERGNWLVHGKIVHPGVPDALGSFPADLPKNRLGLAKWLVSDNNPLTARVIVNRFWEQLFGKGLVPTLEDFGTQGDAPSHPQLLDWLAIQFQFEYNWSVKSLLRLIVNSATYRQSANISPELLGKDPSNRLLARGPRNRLSAEQIRDQALMVSGLLNRKVGGPSVMPHQPEGVWNVIRHVGKWETSQDADQYRRAIYTFWRRVSPYPSMVAFDSPSREYCVSRRITTNTPIQALVTLNDPVYTEAAMALAERMKSEGRKSPEAQLGFGYQLLMTHEISEEKLAVLSSFYEKILEKYQNLPDSKFQNPEEAALFNVANVLLNMDEFIMK